jgi:hypothetical protein
MNDRIQFMKKNVPLFLVLSLFSTLLVIGILIYRDFGVPIDESYQLQTAMVNHGYIFKNDATLLSYEDRYYGVIFELPLLWVSSRFTKPESMYVRHFLLYLAFLASLVIFYLLSRRLFNSSWWGLLAVCMLVFSPRIFADAFYNSKDIAFMEAFILAIWTLVLLIDGVKKKSRKLAICALIFFHAIASSLLIATRVPGVMIIPISLILLFIAELESIKSWIQTPIVLLLYLVLTASFTVLFWPILWHDPLGEFINAFHYMSKLDDYGKAVLYLGEFIPSDELPWHYIPVWIGISTPVVVLVGFFPGLVNWIRSIGITAGKGKNRSIENLMIWISGQETLNWLAVIGWLAIPIIAVYWFHSVLYNGWRQMFFIYPAIVLFSVRGYSALHKWLSRYTGRLIEVTILTVLVIIVGLTEPVWFLIRYHPYGNVYFNQLAGDPATIRQRFETDYWGLSYKEAIDYILATDPSEKIPIYMADTSGLDYINSALSPEQMARFVILDSPDKGARYFVGDFSFHPEDYQYSQSSLEYYSINVRGIKILVVYQFH